MCSLRAEQIQCRLLRESWCSFSSPLSIIISPHVPLTIVPMRKDSARLPQKQPPQYAGSITEAILNPCSERPVPGCIRLPAEHFSRGYPEQPRPPCPGEI